MENKNKVKYWIACSGGVDSVVLTHLMHELGKPIGLLHCNFQLRGEDSVNDERFVKSLASTLHIPIKVKRFDVKGYIDNRGGNTQLAARELRYDWFDEVSKNTGGYICLAHHKDDQVETFLLQLARGGKVKGLASMPFRKGVYLRPLLGRNKREIINLAKDNNWQWREDRSNIENNYKRNLYRNELIPMISEQVAIKENVLSIVNGYQQLLNYFSDITFTKKNRFGVREISSRKWNHLPIVLKRFELDRYGLKNIPVAEVDRLIKSSSGAHLSIDNNSVVKFRDDLLFVNYPLEKWTFSISSSEYDKDEAIRESLEFADRSKISGNLKARKWEAGDRITPLGMNGSKSIGKYLKDKGVPHFYRPIIPVVVDELDRIVFVPGFTVDDRFKLEGFTREIVHCRSSEE